MTAWGHSRLSRSWSQVLVCPLRPKATFGVGADPARRPLGHGDARGRQCDHRVRAPAARDHAHAPVRSGGMSEAGGGLARACPPPPDLGLARGPHAIEWRKSAKPDLRCPVCFLSVEHLDVTQMARGVARPPDAVRVGWIEFNPSRIRLHDRQREFGPRFRLGIEAGNFVRRL